MWILKRQRPSLGLAQSINNHGFAPSCGSHHHGSVSGHHGLVHLDHFIHLIKTEQIKNNALDKGISIQYLN